MAIASFPFLNLLMTINFFSWTMIVSLRPADGGSTSASSAASPQASNTSTSPGTTPSSTAGTTGTPAQPTQPPNILSESALTSYVQIIHCNKENSKHV